MDGEEGLKEVDDAEKGGLNKQLKIVGIGTAVVGIIGWTWGRDATCMEMTDAGPKSDTDEDVERKCGADWCARESGCRSRSCPR
jgi:hypothetical protein